VKQNHEGKKGIGTKLALSLMRPGGKEGDSEKKKKLRIGKRGDRFSSFILREKREGGCLGDRRRGGKRKMYGAPSAVTREMFFEKRRVSDGGGRLCFSHPSKRARKEAHGRCRCWPQQGKKKRGAPVGGGERDVGKGTISRGEGRSGGEEKRGAIVKKRHHLQYISGEKKKKKNDKEEVEKRTKSSSGGGENAFLSGGKQSVFTRKRTSWGERKARVRLIVRCVRGKGKYRDYLCLTGRKKSFWGGGGRGHLL